MANALKSRLLNNTTIDDTASIMDSKVYSEKDMIPTSVPIINLGLSGKIDGGIYPGIHMLAGPSKHFKTGFAFLMAAAFLKKYPDGMILFYDTEFGTPIGYLDMFNINKDNIIHSPVMDIEILKVDIKNQLEGLTRDDKVMIIIDSVGNVPSKKESDDAKDGKVVADMSRAKALKSLFRVVTPHVVMKDIPMIVVNHTYMEIGMFPKAIVSGGTGSYYSASTIWILGRQQEKEDKEIAGYNFVVNVEKSRYVKEKSKFIVNVMHDSGISKWTGLFENALEGGYIVSEKKGWYKLPNAEKSRRAADIENSSEFWKAMFADTDFDLYLKNKYSLGQVKMLSDDDDVEAAPKKKGK